MFLTKSNHWSKKQRGEKSAGKCGGCSLEFPSIMAPEKGSHLNTHQELLKNGDIFIQWNENETAKRGDLPRSICTHMNRLYKT